MSQNDRVHSTRGFRAASGRTIRPAAQEAAVPVPAPRELASSSHLWRVEKASWYSGADRHRPRDSGALALNRVGRSRGPPRLRPRPPLPGRKSTPPSSLTGSKQAARPCNWSRRISSGRRLGRSCATRRRLSPSWSGRKSGNGPTRESRASRRRQVPSRGVARRMDTAGATLAHGQKTQLVPDETTAPIVQRIFRDIAAGSSARKVAMALSASGVPTATGRGTWIARRSST